jgi:catechol 2,3-dioxygenase-like lactoylglutathione lyase family enzyme
MAGAYEYPVVHLELRTGNLPRACAFYAELLGWGPERVDTAAGSYLALAIDGLGGGLVECERQRAVWLPYVEVDDIAAVTDRARSLGPRCGWSRAKGRRAGGASSPRGRAARSPSGSRSPKPSTVSRRGPEHPRPKGIRDDRPERQNDIGNRCLAGHRKGDRGAPRRRWRDGRGALGEPTSRPGHERNTG